MLTLGFITQQNARLKQRRTLSMSGKSSRAHVETVVQKNQIESGGRLWFAEPGRLWFARARMSMIRQSQDVYDSANPALILIHNNLFVNCMTRTFYGMLSENMYHPLATKSLFFLSVPDRKWLIKSSEFCFFNF